MKIRKLFMSVALISFILVMQGCKKEKACRTCYATYGGYTIAEKKACSNAEEEEFKSAHTYATVSCK